MLDTSIGHLGPVGIHAVPPRVYTGPFPSRNCASQHWFSLGSSRLPVRWTSYESAAASQPEPLSYDPDLKVSTN